MKRLVRHTKKIKKNISKHSKTLARHAKDHFIPHTGNNHHPHVLKHHVLFGYTAIIILLKVLVMMVWAAYPSLDLRAMAITPENIVMLTNQARTTAGLTALASDKRLFASAQAKAVDMLQNQYFAHNSPTGVTPWHWIKSHGYAYLRSAENLAVHYSSAEGVEAGWIASPDHRKQIYNPEYKDTGVGIAQGKFEGVDTIFVVQHFGIPLNPSPTQTASSTPIAVQPEPVVKPTNQGVTITVKDSQAGTVKASVNDKAIPLKQNSVGEWKGNIVQKDAQTENQILNIITTDKAGITTSSPAAILSASPQAIFGAENSQINADKLFGMFTADDVNRFSRAVYVFLIIFLLSALLLNVLVKIKIQNIKAIAHTMSVIGLLAFLLLS